MNIVDKPKVLMIGPGRRVMGGITTVINSYFELGLDQGCHLSYLASMVDGNKLLKFLIAALSYIRFCFTVKRYDIIHIHMAAQASFFRKALFIKKGYRANKDIIIHQHAADFDDFYFNQCDDAGRKRIRDIFAMAEKIIVLSEEWAEFFAKNICDSKKIIILHNGVIMPDYCGKNYSNHNVLFLGRLGERKGTYDLLKAIPAVLRDIPDAMFYLGGDGDVEKCRLIAQTQGFANHVQFLGWVNPQEKDKYLRICSTFCLPSYHEGMPMSVLEAMSYGCATLSTNVGGIPQIIENGVNGIRIQAGDVDALSNGLICLLADDSLREQLGNAAVDRINSKFDVSHNVKFLTVLYQAMRG